MAYRHSWEGQIAMASDEKDRLGEKLGHLGSAVVNDWASKNDSVLLAKLKQAAQEQLAKEKHERRTPRAFNRVLCAFDFGQGSLKALDLARSIAVENEAALYLLHVCPTVTVPLGGPTTATPEVEEAARQKLREVALERLEKVPHELLVVTGDPARRIPQIQSALGIDLIVMGTFARRGVPRFFLGSVADHVVRAATCPVLTVKGR
jgi:nucleotide-binding universal stress UspA family protein